MATEQTNEYWYWVLIGPSGRLCARETIGHAQLPTHVAFGGNFCFDS